MKGRLAILIVLSLTAMLVAVPAASAFSMSVTGIAPSSGQAGATVQCMVSGAFYAPVDGLLTIKPAFSLEYGMNPPIVGVTDAASVTATSASVSFTLPATAPAVWYTLEATQNHGFGPITDTYSLAHAFQVAPTISALSPNTATAGAGELTLTVNGGGFVNSAGLIQGSSVRWNGAAVDTTFNSATKLTAIIPAAKLTTAGTAEVTVMNVTADTTSAPATFTIGAQAPILTSLSPTSVWAGYVRNDVVLTVNGSSFLAGAHIFLSGGEKAATTFVSASQLTVPLVAADIATPMSLIVSVRNPPFPPGVPSALALPLPVQAETTDPAVTIAGADAGWHNAPVALTFSATDSQSGVQKVQYRSPPTVAAWVDGTSYTVPTTTQGAVIVNAQALDWCNKVGVSSATVNIDITKPTTDALNAVSLKRNKTATLKFRIGEPVGLSPSAAVVIEIKAAGGGRTIKTIPIDGVLVNADQTCAVKASFRKGSYKWYVYATDLAGNTQANIDSAKFTVK